MKIKKILNDEKGSITIFVLTMVLFVLSVILVVYFSTNNKVFKQRKDLEIIQEEYQSADANSKMEEAYNNYISNNAIPGVRVENTQKDNYTDGEDTATIPAGFTVSGIEEEQKISTGLVIYEIPKGETVDWDNDIDNIRAKYNQFVWVPVKDIDSMSQCMIADGECDLQLQSDGTLKCVTHESSNIVGKLWVTSVGGSFGDENNSYNANDGLREPAIVTDNNMGTGTGYDGKNYEEAGYTSASNMLEDFKKQYKIMSASVAKNGGFYIGRYEMSLSTANSDSPGTNGKPSSKAGVMPTSAENSATSMWYGLYRTAKTYTVEEDSVVSSMVWGSQYDAMLNWVKNGNGLDASKVTDNSGIGNNGTSTVSTTGNSVYSDDKINNIRDLAGNLYEWTLEAYSTSYRIIRGR